MIVALNTLIILTTIALAEELEEQRVIPDEDIVIAPSTEGIDDDIQNEEQVIQPWVPDYDPNECIGVVTQEDGRKSVENNEDEIINSAGIPIFGAIACFVLVAGLLIVHKKKK